MIKEFLSLSTVILCTFTPCISYAYTLPSFQPNLIPNDTEPQPEIPMRKQNSCAIQNLLSSTISTPYYINFLEIDRLWHQTMGNGQTIGIISTGIQPNSRISVEGAGDFVNPTEHGLEDCDGTGTLAASIIATQPSHTDELIGVAPRAKIMSLRIYSTAYSFQTYAGNSQQNTSPILNPDGTDAARMVKYLAKAIVHLTNKGVQTILSPSICIPVNYAPDLRPLAAAIHYATDIKGVVIVAASSPNISNLRTLKCGTNPPVNFNDQEDIRNWKNVAYLSLPSIFPKVLSVAWTNEKGELLDSTTNAYSGLSGAQTVLGGPWVKISAPGTNIIGLGINGKPIDSFLEQDNFVKINGSFYAAAIVAGSVALIRSMHPLMTVNNVINALTMTAHNAGSVNNSIGYGLIDPLEANANFDIGSINTTKTSVPISAFNGSFSPSQQPKIIALISSLIVLLLFFFLWAWHLMSKKEKSS